jgi:hypothetical protein
MRVAARLPRHAPSAPLAALPYSIQERMSSPTGLCRWGQRACSEVPVQKKGFWNFHPLSPLKAYLKSKYSCASSCGRM